MKNVNLGKYSFEFLSIFIAVISAFALNNWNDNRKSADSERKILREIRNGIELDLQDFEGNMYGHRQSIAANRLFRDLIGEKEVKQDSMAIKYTILFRDYVPIINLSGYESLKANGLKTVQNDALRFEIISLYDFFYSIIEKLESEVEEMQSYPNYFKPINDILHPFMVFDENGHLQHFKEPLQLSDRQKKELLSYLWRLESNRSYKLGRYKIIREKMKVLKDHLDEELGS